LQDSCDRLRKRVRSEGFCRDSLWSRSSTSWCGRQRGPNTTHVVFTRPGSLTKALKEPEKTNTLYRVTRSLTTSGPGANTISSRTGKMRETSLPTDDLGARLYSANSHTYPSIRARAFYRERDSNREPFNKINKLGGTNGAPNRAILRKQSTERPIRRVSDVGFSRLPDLSPRRIHPGLSSFIDESDDYPVRKLPATCPLQELPISTPVPKTRAPPSATCVAADKMGVSM